MDPNDNSKVFEAADDDYHPLEVTVDGYTYRRRDFNWPNEANIVFPETDSGSDEIRIEGGTIKLPQSRPQTVRLNGKNYDLA